MEHICKGGSSSARTISFAENEVESLISELYDLQVKFVLKYDSYSDTTYLLEDVTPSSLPLISISRNQRKYTFKVNSAAFKDPRKTSIQNDVILFAKEAGFPVSAPIRTKDGHFQTLLPFGPKGDWGRDIFTVRLFEFLPGTPLAKVTLTKPLCRQIGYYSGWLDTIYQKYAGYDESVKMILNGQWDLSELPKLKGDLDLIKDSNRHSLVKNIISAFEDEVLRYEQNFSRGFIHGDMNESNILVSQRKETEYGGEYGASIPLTSSEEPFHVIGIIDFGDLAYSCLLFEVAIGICYVMMNKSSVPILEAAGCVLCNYLKHVKLSDFELRRLKICVCARLALSAVHSLRAQRDNPDNSYRLQHLHRQWAPMEMIWPMSDDQFLRNLLQEGTSLI